MNFIESALRTWGTDNAGRLAERLIRLREDLTHFVLPERRARSYPRAVKIKMSNYARKRPAPLRRESAPSDQHCGQDRPGQRGFTESAPLGSSNIMTVRPAYQPTSEIGRASCRERV